MRVLSAAPAWEEAARTAARATAEGRARQAEQVAGLVAGAAEARVEAELSAVDRRVRSHEQTHIALAGPYAESAASYITVRGPDGRRYAVGGSVKVDLQPVPGNPEATIRKMKAIRRAAFGPMGPSGADMRVAAKAYRLEMAARRELEAEKAEEAAEKEEAKAERAERLGIDILI